MGIYGPDPERPGALGGEIRSGGPAATSGAACEALYGDADGKWQAGRKRWSANGAPGGLGQSAPLAPIDEMSRATREAPVVRGRWDPGRVYLKTLPPDS